MLLTVTPNPAIDRVFFLPAFRMGAILRAEREVMAASGKGVDVSIFAHLLGEPTMATGFNAGHSGQLLAALLEDQGVPHNFVAAQGETRTAVLLVDMAAGNQSTVTAPTLTASAGHLEQLMARLEHYGRTAWGVVMAGSLAKGLPADCYARLLRPARRAGLLTLLDTSGEALRSGVTGLPCILKVNETELLALAPDLGDLAAVADRRVDGASLAARLIAHLGEWASDAIVVTLGSQGVLAVTTEGLFEARPPAVRVVSTAGAGDAVSTGIVIGRQRGDNWPATLRLATALAASAVMHEGTSVLDPAEADALMAGVEVRSLS